MIRQPCLILEDEVDMLSRNVLN